VQNRIEIPRRTTLAVGGVRVDMVEHIMAALAGLRIDNCEVWVDQPEMPGCDGSSQPFVEACWGPGSFLRKARCASNIAIDRRMRVGDDSCWVEARPHSHERPVPAVFDRLRPDRPDRQAGIPTDRHAGDLRPRTGRRADFSLGTGSRLAPQPRGLGSA
jgi:hypothetical protein